MVYPNNSDIVITEIGQTNNSASPPPNTGIQCITDRRPCCASTPNRFGQWIFPNGSYVPISTTTTTFYRNRGDDGTVNLNRLNDNVTMPTGRFCCELPDAADVLQTLCVNILPGEFTFAVVSAW